MTQIDNLLQGNYINLEKIIEYNKKIKEERKKLVTEAEKLLKKYSNSNLGIMGLKDNEFNKLLNDFKLEICNNKDKVYTYNFHLMKIYSFSNNELKYKLHCNYNNHVTEPLVRSGAAFAIGLIILRNKIGTDKDNFIADYIFQIPNTHSMELTLYEKTFIYSLIISYSGFLECYENFYNDVFYEQKNHSGDNFYDIEKWIDYLTCSYPCANRELAILINDFYWELYYEELKTIQDTYNKEFRNYIKIRCKNGNFITV